MPFLLNAGTSFLVDTSGGALAHSGVITMLSNTTFESNKAGEEGLAVISFGEVTDLLNVSFTGHAYHCDKGSYGFDQPLEVRCNQSRQ